MDDNTENQAQPISINQSSQSIQTPPIPNVPQPSAQQDKTQKTDKKGLIPSLASLVIITLGIAGYFAYQNFQHRKEQPDSSLNVSTPTTPTTYTLSPTPDPTSDWETYSGNGYFFKYPTGLESDTEAAGKGVESFRVQFLGPKQKAGTSLYDGYSFVVTKIDSNTSKTAEQQAQEEKENSEENCGFDQSTISSITQTQVAGINASQYSVTECFGDFTNSYLVNNGNLYRITQLYTGEEPEKQKYKAIADHILSSFSFDAQDSNGDLLSARNALVSYFSYLSKGDYEQALQYHGSGFGYIDSFCPTNTYNTQVKQLECVCSRALKCLGVKQILKEGQSSPSQYGFLVQFSNPDGSLFKRGPCCGATEETMPTQTDFEYIVEKQGEEFKVKTQLIYIP